MHNKIMRLLTLLLSVLVLQISLVGCNTMQGAGEDVKAAGSAVEKKAKEEKSY